VAPDQFHARHSCLRKTYEYRIFPGEVCPPWLARYVYVYTRPLDIGKMRQAAAAVLGEHDFTSFAASDPDMKARHAQIATAAGNALGTEGRDASRTIFESDWQRRLCDGSPSALEGHPQSSGDPMNPTGTLLVYRVCGSGFLHHMVRNLVGTFLEVGRGNMAVEEIPTILKAHSRRLAGPTAPARGLFLSKVFY
jgi:tRNA pseudouridine38-40 synthase